MQACIQWVGHAHLFTYRREIWCDSFNRNIIYNSTIICQLNLVLFKKIKKYSLYMHSIIVDYDNYEHYDNEPFFVLCHKLLAYVCDP